MEIQRIVVADAIAGQRCGDVVREPRRRRRSGVKGIGHRECRHLSGGLTVSDRNDASSSCETISRPIAFRIMSNDIFGNDIFYSWIRRARAVRSAQLLLRQHRRYGSCRCECRGGWGGNGASLRYRSRPFMPSERRSFSRRRTAPYAPCGGETRPVATNYRHYAARYAKTRMVTMSQFWSVLPI